MKKLTHFATIGMVQTFLSGYSTAILAENKPALTASSIVEVMNSLDNITNSSYCQNFRIDTEDAESSFGTGHHQASVMLDEPWSNNYSQMFVASSGDFKGSIYSFNAGKGSIDDRFGWLNQDDTLSVDDKVNLSSEKHPSD
ncbi:MAG: hypothetical protein MJK04_12025, partial [Psychrosphaera sp.]|nr:hypothetical protein [Psychrosphaera sp.]